MRSALDDVRDAWRGLRKAPRFLIISAATLALGIGASTAIFSVVNAVLLRPLPYPQADRLVNVWSTAPGLSLDRFPLSPDLFLFYERHSTVFEHVGLFQGTRVNVTESGAPEVVDAAIATSGYFRAMGATFSRGRAFTAEEDRPEAPRVAVVSHRLWARRYGGDPALVGGTIRLDGERAEVVGVAPPLMDRPGSPDVWLPARFNQADPPSGNFGWNAVGRLKDGVRPDQAAGHLEPLVARALAEMIDSPNYRAFLTDGQYRPLVHAMNEDVIGSAREPLWILLGTVLTVLLIACGNVANLSLVRAEGRQREIAVRAAIGGSRGGLIRMFLAESILVSAAGGAAGLAVAAAGLPALLQLAPETVPRLEEVRLDPVVLLFALGATVVSALLFGLVPAIRYTRPDILAALRQGGRSATGHPSTERGRQLLVIAQTAMALVLLVGSGLLARSFAQLMDAEHGFATENVLAFRVALPETSYREPSRVVRFTEDLVARLSDLPGVELAGAATEIPLTGTPSGTAFEIEGYPVEAGRLPPLVQYSTVTSGFFETMQIPVLQGEGFDSSDARDDVYRIIVNRAAADRYWPDQDAIGKRLRPGSSASPPDRPWFTIKAIVGDVRHANLREPPVPQFYFPLVPRGDSVPRAYGYVLRGPRAHTHAATIRESVWALDPDLPVAGMRTMDDVVQRSVVQFTFTMVTLGLAAAIALVLGTVGLYGVLSYAVSLRRREIGVRMALGAPPSLVMRGVLANAALITFVGLVVGMLGAFALTRFLSGLLYEIAPLDAVTFAGMSALLFGVALFAAYLPARRAALVSPMEAMRAE